MYGQYILLFPDPDFPQYALATWLEKSLQLGMPDLKSQLFGAALLVAGGSMLIYFVQRTVPLNPEFNPGGKLSLPITRKVFSSRGFIASIAINIFLLAQLMRHNTSNYLVLAWIASLVPVAILAWQLDRQSKIQLSPNLQRQDIVTLLLVLFVGLLFGAYRLEGVPNFLIGDEGTFWTTARDIVSGKYSPSVFDFGVYTYPILSSYYQAGIMAVSGLNIWGWRFSSLLAGLLAVPALYLLARELFNRRIATLGALALVFSPYFLAFSRFGYNNSQTLLPVTLAIALGYLGIKRSSLFYLLLAGYAAGMGFYTYTAAQSGLVILGMFTFILLLQKHNQRKQVIMAGLIILFGWYLVASPHRAYGLVKDQGGFQVKLGESIFFNADYAPSFVPEDQDPSETGIYFGKSDMFYFEPQTWLVMSLRATVRTLLVFHTPTLVTEHMVAYPLAGTAGSLFFLLGLGYSLSRFRERRNIILLSWHVVTLLALSILNTFPPRQTHMVGIIPLIAIWVGLGIDLLARLLAFLVRPLGNPIGKTITMATLVAVVAGFGLHDYFIKAPQTYWPQEEHIISWAALYNPDTNFLFVVPPDGNENFKPFVMREIAPQIAYQTVSLDALPAALDENRQQASVLYVQPASRPLITTEAWPQSAEKTYTNREGFPILHAVTNDPAFLFSIPYGFTPSLGDAFGAPAIWLAIILIALAVLVIFASRAWLARLPAPIRRFSEWVSESPEPLPVEEESKAPLQEQQTQIIPKTMESPAVIETSSEPAQHVIVPQAIEKKESKQRFIEVEFKFRINLGGGIREWASSTVQTRPVRQAFSDWKQRFFAGLTSNDWIIERLHAAPLLGLSFILAILAQFMLNAKIIVPGIALYMATAGFLLTWFRKNPESASRIIDIAKLQPKKEWLLILFVLAIGIFARTYQAGNFPYGIEGDEAKWGLQAFYSTILQVKQGVFGHHFENQPVSFYLIGLAMRLSEINLLVPRYLNAALSCLSLVLFYFALRRAANQPVALVGTFLYATSFTALSAGRQALHDTYIEIWINLAFLALVYGLDNRKPWQMLVAGIALALGSLTYETFYPVLAIFLAYALIHLIKNRQDWNQTTWQILSIILPLGIIAPQLISYIIMRENHHLNPIRNLAGSINPDNPLLASILASLQFFGGALQTLFVSVVYPDSLTRWTGPIVNPWILPFFFIGLVIALRQIRLRHNLLLVLWFFVGFFGFSLLGAGYPRVLFAALMPIYALAGLGMVAGLNMMRSLSVFSTAGQNRRLISGFAALLLFLAIYDAQVFINLPDKGDRQQRRELYDTFTTSLQASPVTLLPYTQRFENVISLEAEILDMLALGIFDLRSTADKYKILPVEQAMPNLWLAREKVNSIDVIIDKTTLQKDDTYEQGLKTLLACYPNHTKTETKYFELYTFTNLKQPICFSLFAPTATTPAQRQILPANQPILLNWDDASKEAKHTITIQALQQGTLHFEAEDMAADGWYPEDKHAADFSGTGYLTDNFNAGVAQISFEIEQPGEYTLWVRTYRRLINDHVNYLALNSNPPVKIAQGGEETFETWIWEAIGPYFLEKGSHTITASRTYGSQPQFSVFLDAFVISPNPDYNPEEGEVWVDVFTSPPLAADQTSYTYLPGLPAGQYRWWISYATTPGLVNWLGADEINTEPVEFSVKSSP